MFKIPLTHISDEKRVTKIMKTIIEGGTDNLQVIFDFDCTLTKANQSSNTFVLIDSCRSIFPQYTNSAKEFIKEYFKIEYNRSIPKSEKFTILNEVFSNFMNNLIGTPLPPDYFPKKVEEEGPALRDGIKSTLTNLYEANIPVLIFSAGFGNFIEIILKTAGLLYPNIQIIANYFTCKDGIIHSMKNKPINSINKSNPAYLECVQTRKNIVLVGDALGDASMADGILCKENVLKIGLKCKANSQTLADFLKVFDIVVEDATTLDAVNQILSQIY